MPSEEAAAKATCVDRSRPEDRPHVVGRHHPRSQVLRRPGLHHSQAGASGPADLLHARSGEDDASRCDVASVADGRSGGDVAPSAGGRSRKGGCGAGRGVCRSQCAHRRIHRRLQGPHHRRALHAWHHQGHAARKLVDGEEHRVNALLAAGEGRHLSARSAGAGSRVAERRRPAQEHPDHASAAHEQRAAIHRDAGSRLHARQGLPGSLLHVHGRRERLRLLRASAACSFRQTPRAAIATPIRSR